MKEFSFETAWGSPQRVAWLKENQYNTISEEEFVSAFKKLRKHSTSKLGRTKRHMYTPCNLKRTYRFFVSEFGFFQGSK